MENLKMIIMDMDGTLLNDEGVISERTFNALMKAQENGVKIVLASGRSWKTLEAFGKQLKMDEYNGYFIGVNGACITEVKTMEHNRIAQLYPKDIHDLFNEIKQYEVEMMGVQDSTIFNYIPDSLREIKRQYRIDNNIPDDVPWTGGTFKLVVDQRKGYPEIYDLPTLENLDVCVNKMTLCHNADVLAKAYPKIVEKFNGKYNFNRTSPSWIEIAPQNISKGNAIDILQKQFDIKPEETYIFGDGENDLSMFDYGVAVAMGNAMDTVKAQANMVTLDNNHDGIAEVIEKVFVEK